MPEKSFHLHLVSDATGETITSITRACLANFEDFSPIQHNWWLVRSKGQIDRVIEGIKNNPGPVLLTLGDGENKTLLCQGCHSLNIPVVDALSGVMDLFSVLARTDAQKNIFPTRRSLAQLNDVATGLEAVRDAIEFAEIMKRPKGVLLGHNNPPEPINAPPLHVEDVDAVISIVHVYRSQLSQDSSSSQHLIDGCESVFAAFGKRLGEFIAWLRNFPSAMWDAVVNKSPEWAAKSLFHVTVLAAAVSVATALLR
ncbi:MAG: kinase/pyrophosphorylase [Pigmentiphaga sp.]